MRKHSLSEWASIAEIVGAVGIIVSLLFVVHSINRNTAILEYNAESEFLDAWRTAVQMPFYTNERLAEIQLKAHTGEDLSPVEGKIWETSLRALFDTWAQGHSAFRTGVMSGQTWEAWNSAIFKMWDRERMGPFWEEMGHHWAETAFGQHINEELARRAGGTAAE